MKRNQNYETKSILRNFQTLQQELNLWNLNIDRYTSDWMWHA